MKLRYIILLITTFCVGIIAFNVYTWVNMFRFPGDRGDIYDRWETTNDTFKVRMTAYYEVGVYLPGAFFVCEAAPHESNDWREFKMFRTDDAIPISHFTPHFRFVNSQTAYFYTVDDFSVTLDAGRNWSVWKAVRTFPDGTNIYWGITEAQIESNGNGKTTLKDYDRQVGKEIWLEVFTKDFGQTWSEMKK